MAARTASASTLAWWSALMTSAVSRISGNETATRATSLLSTIVSPLASRISPRGADNDDAKKCCRVARIDHCFPSTTCTFAARATRPIANKTKKPCTMAARLGAFILTSPWKYYNLPVGRHVHAQATLHRCAERLSARSGADLGFQASSLALQAGAFCFQHREPLRLTDADRSPPDDGQRAHEERAEKQPDQTATAQSYAAFRHARRRALLERGFFVPSMSVGLSPRLVTSSPRALPRQVHVSCFGGQMQARLQFPIASLTQPSSPE